MIDELLPPEQSCPLRPPLIVDVTKLESVPDFMDEIMKSLESGVVLIESKEDSEKSEIHYLYHRYKPIPNVFHLDLNREWVDIQSMR